MTAIGLGKLSAGRFILGPGAEGRKYWFAATGGRQPLAGLAGGMRDLITA